MTATHPRHELDELVHQPVRFSLLATLAAAEEAEFSFVRDAIEVSDSVLSKHAATLEAAGYLAVRKGHVGKRPRTWLRLTEQGRAAFDAHVERLKAIAAGER
jgi:DNA-binding MarR family transcriptional regulator